LDKIIQGMVTFDGKDYCLEEFAENIKALTVPENVDLSRITVDNSADPAHSTILKHNLDGEVYWLEREKDASSRKIICDSYNLLLDMLPEDTDFLFTVEADVFPPKGALIMLYKFMKENPKAAVVAALTGYPKKDGDDGLTHGFHKMMVYRFLKDEEQEYEEIEATDNEAMENQKLRILQDKFGMQYLVKGEDKIVAKCKNPKTMEKLYKKHLKRVKIITNTVRIPKHPPVLPMDVDYENPARVEGLHLGCTLIRKKILDFFKFRYEEDKDWHSDTFWFQDLMKAGLEVYSYPIVVGHQHLPWGKDVKW